MSQKPLGQIAHEAKLVIDLNAWMTPAWVDLPPPRQKAEEAAAQAIRNAVIEECAEIADKWGKGDWRVQPEGKKSRYDLQDLQTYTNVAGRGIAEDIRSLKSS